MNVRNFSAGIAVTAAVMAVVTACGSAASQQAAPAGAKSWDQANEEYLGETKSLTLPADLRFPAQLPRDKTTDGSPNTFQDGVGRGQADHLWYCSWESAWLKDLSANSPAAKTDLNTLKRFDKLSAYTQSTVPGDRHIYTDAWARADLGDPSLIQQDVNANCNLSQLSAS